MVLSFAAPAAHDGAAMRFSRRSRSVASKRDPRTPLWCAHHTSHERKLAEAMRKIHPVAYHKFVGTFERREIRTRSARHAPQVCRAARRSARAPAPRARMRSLANASVRPDSRMSSTIRTLRSFTSVSMSRTMSTRPGRACRFAIAGKRQEIDLRRQAGAMHRAQQIGGEHEAALQDRHHQQAFQPGPGDALGHRVDALGDGLGRKHDLDGLGFLWRCRWHGRPSAIAFNTS